MVKTIVTAATSAATLLAMSAAAEAQMNMPGMTMPQKRAPAKRPAHALNRPSQKKTSSNRAQERTSGQELPPANIGGPTGAVNRPMTDGAPSSPVPARPTDQSGSTMRMPMGSSQMPAETKGVPSRSSSAGAMPMPMIGEHGGTSPMAPMSAAGAYGSYPGSREASGTAWQPDSSNAMSGPMLMSGNWMLMAHGVLNLVGDHQSGPRGGDKAFASGMLMGMARYKIASTTIQLRGMVSPDPIMGSSGYPLLLASGETANGRTPLVDRQHPHDLFMELSASASRQIGPKTSLFLYGGLPGEPAFGPPAFMHREAVLDSPEAPITHHWLDSTHIAYGVLTAGLVVDRFKIEASQFNAREPDQHRWNIETGPLDSTSIRLSFNPARTLALQGSWGRFKDPEQLEPGVNQTRWSASVLWADDPAPGWHAAATLAWGRKSSGGHNDDGIAAEASLKHSGWTVFGRGEWISNRELLGVPDGPAFKVGKVSLGAIRDFRVARNVSFGAGGLLSANFVPDALAPLYGGHNPVGAMGFVRLKLN